MSPEGVAVKMNRWWQNSCIVWIKTNACWNTQTLEHIDRKIQEIHHSAHIE